MEDMGLIEVRNLILGAGIAGLATAQRLKEINQDFIIIEKENKYGGLCSSYSLEGFTFDHFIHMSFTTNDFVRKYLDVTPYYSFEPNPFNYYHGIWIKHPAINNLYPLSEKEKEKILEGLKERKKYECCYTDSYEMWLRYQFGDYFAEHFPLSYTRKYWAEEASNMETNWIGSRVYQPTMDEIFSGMKTAETPVTYYAKEMRYPKNGGFSEYLKNFAYPEFMKLNETVVGIDTENCIVETDKDIYHYHTLFSSIPLPEMGDILKNEGLRNIVKDLHWTSGYIVSIGVTGELQRSDLWDYIYDEDIAISRFYSPSLMSPQTAPEGFSSVQAEIYTKDGKRVEDEELLLQQVIEQLEKIGVIDKANVCLRDIRFSKYCNILFDHKVYDSKKDALKILKEKKIIPIGRFGRWEYLWSDQAFMSGYEAVLKQKI